jgi:hypothetical protein
MSLAVMLSVKAHDEASLVFSVIFVIMWVGAAVVTINGQLLGGRLSFFQSVCLLGYCVFPILISATACFAYNEFVTAKLAVVLRFVSVVIALIWSIIGALRRFGRIIQFWAINLVREVVPYLSPQYVSLTVNFIWISFGHHVLFANCDVLQRRQVSCQMPRCQRVANSLRCTQLFFFTYPSHGWY